jgi:hypothetical protein
MTTALDVSQLTSDQRRNLMLGRAVAEAVEKDPERALTIARVNLMELYSTQPRGRAKRHMADWSVLLDSPLPGIVEALTSTSQQACELREYSPFFGVLHQHQRLALLASFRESQAGQRDEHDRGDTDAHRDSARPKPWSPLRRWGSSGS